MKRLLAQCFIFTLIISSHIFAPQVIFAINPDIVTAPIVPKTDKNDGFTIESGQANFTITFTSTTYIFDKNKGYTLLVSSAGKEVQTTLQLIGGNQDTKDPTSVEKNKLVFQFPNTGRDVQEPGVHKFSLYDSKSSQVYSNINDKNNSLLAQGAYRVIYKGGDIALYMSCTQIQKGTSTQVYVINPQPNVTYSFWLDGGGSFLDKKTFNDTEPFTDTLSGSQTTRSKIPWDFKTNKAWTTGKKKLCMEATNNSFLGTTAGVTCRWSLPFELVDDVVDQKTCKAAQSNISGEQGPVSTGNSGKSSDPTPTPIPTPILPPCIEGKDSSGKIIAIPTLAPGNTNAETIKTALTQIKKCTKVDSALGAISTDPQGFILWLFRILLSISGGIALLAIIAAGYRYMTSQGNAEAVKAAQEQITSAIVGLLFLVFSMVMLQVIGVDIIQLPGLKASVQVGGNAGNLK